MKQFKWQISPPSYDSTEGPIQSQIDKYNSSPIKKYDLMYGDEIVQSFMYNHETKEFYKGCINTRFNVSIEECKQITQRRCIAELKAQKIIIDKKIIALRELL
jgi:hypothetical protein